MEDSNAKRSDEVGEVSPIEQKMREVEARLGALESFFSSFVIVGGDGVEVAGDLKTGFVINKR